MDDVAPSGLPALVNNFLTFGGLNNFCKVTDETLGMWGKALAKVPNSRLILHCPDVGSARRRVLDKLGEHDVAAERIEFFSRFPRLEYFNLYHRIDICLDTLPYTGGITSLDSFWMGVPVVTRIGRTVVGRHGWSQLSNLGLTELAARDDDEFVSIVTTLADDLPRLADLRRTLRDRIEQSPLMDVPKYARNVENAYREMWHTWLAESST
jgi:predicted O-linked N-acetylglucosamine transferase (SPINDLY family)